MNSRPALDSSFLVANYQLVILDSIWENIENPLIEEYLYQVFATKKKGYGSRHQHCYVPIGKEDFIGNHILICKKVDGRNLPLCMGKITSSTTCHNYGVEHPMITLMRGAFDNEYFSYVSRLIHEADAQGIETSYSGGFTINRDLLASKNELELMKEMYCAFHTLLHRDRKIDQMFGFSCPRLHTDELFKTWGLYPIELNGECPSAYPELLNKEEVKCVIADVITFSDFAEEMAKKYFALWDTRYDNNQKSVKAIAA